MSEGDVREVYRLECTDCGFEETVEPDVDAAYDVIEAHESAHEEAAERHFVNLELVADD